MKQTANVEKIADEFLRGYLRQNPALELISVQCRVDSKALAKAATHDEVNEFLETLPRYDATDTDTTVPLHVEPEESEALDLDQPEPEPVILARKRKHHLLYFAGFFKHRPLWTTDSRCARVFTSEDEVVIEAFQFVEDGAVLKEVLMDLGLQMLPAPPIPE